MQWKIFIIKMVLKKVTEKIGRGNITLIWKTTACFSISSLRTIAGATPNHHFGWD